MQIYIVRAVSRSGTCVNLAASADKDLAHKAYEAIRAERPNELISVDTLIALETPPLTPPVAAYIEGKPVALLSNVVGVTRSYRRRSSGAQRGVARAVWCAKVWQVQRQGQEVKLSLLWVSPERPGSAERAWQDAREELANCAPYGGAILMERVGVPKLTKL